MAACAAEKDDRVTLARGFCSMHYARFLNHGTLDVVQRPCISIEERRIRKCAQRRASYARHPESQRNYLLRKKYDLSSADYDRILFEQNGKCAICETTDPGGKYGVFIVDHDHWAEAVFGWKLVRGILCSKCNIAAGQVNDDPKIATALSDYLRTGGR